jgi:hypothetical protein
MPQFQLFTIPRMFRNQQVAGSIPAGGSIQAILSQSLAAIPSALNSVASANRTAGMSDASFCAGQQDLFCDEV